MLSNQNQCLNLNLNTCSILVKCQNDYPSPMCINLVSKSNFLSNCICNVNAIETKPTKGESGYLKHYICGNVRYYTHLYCLAVQASFYSDAVECLTATQEILVRSSAGIKSV